MSIKRPKIKNSKPVLLLSLSIAFFLFFNHFSVYAQEKLKLYIGDIKIIPVHNPSRIVIGNPQVADVTSVTEQAITLTAKGVGTTTFVFWDDFGEQPYQLRVCPEDMNRVKERVDNLLKEINVPDVYTKAVDVEGKVLLLGEVNSEQERELIDLALGKLKEKTTDLIRIKEEEATVDIDVQVLELNKDATRTLGIGYPTSVTFTESSGPTSGAVSSLKALFHVSDWTRGAFTSTLNLLVKEGKARILSHPHLACQSGKEAELLVGGEKPIFTTSTTEGGSVSSSVEYKEYGIKLKIRPIVAQANKIKVSLNVEVSDVGTAEFLGTESDKTAQAYPFTKRTTSTELYLNDGQTLTISGLIKHKTEEDIQKFPWLGDIPVLGAFFRKRSTKIGGGAGERGNTELFITLTPTIIRQEAPLEKIPPSKNTISKSAAGTCIGASTFSSSPLEKYSSIISRFVQANLAYPAYGKKMNLEGDLVLSLHLSFSGELLDARLKKSSGLKMLDNNALKVAGNISPYPPFPQEIKKKDLWIDIPIIYSLDR
jgi:pilus assembly protein CpaC